MTYVPAFKMMINGIQTYWTFSLPKYIGTYFAFQKKSSIVSFATFANNNQLSKCLQTGHDIWSQHWGVNTALCHVALSYS